MSGYCFTEEIRKDSLLFCLYLYFLEDSLALGAQNKDIIGWRFKILSGWERQQVQFNAVTQLCPTLCDPTDCSTPGFPVHHQLLELAQIHVHQVGDAIQPPHPLLSPSFPAFCLQASPWQSQHWLLCCFFLLIPVDTEKTLPIDRFSFVITLDIVLGLNFWDKVRHNSSSQSYCSI